MNNCYLSIYVNVYMCMWYCSTEWSYEFSSLLTACWCRDPYSRPSFTEIIETLKVRYIDIIILYSVSVYVCWYSYLMYKLYIRLYRVSQWMEIVFLIVTWWHWLMMITNFYLLTYYVYTYFLYDNVILVPSIHIDYVLYCVWCECNG